MPTEPTLSEVHADLVNRLEQDKRLRTVEQGQAATNAEVAAMRGDLARLEVAAHAGFSELKDAIRDNKPKPAWPAVSSIAACIALILVVAERLYS